MTSREGQGFENPYSLGLTRGERNGVPEGC